MKSGYAAGEIQHRRVPKCKNTREYRSTNPRNVHIRFRCEITLPQRLGRGPHELVPCSLAALWTWIQAVYLQDVLDRLARDLVDAQSAKLSQFPGVAPGVLSSQLHHECPDVVRRSRPTWLTGRDLLRRLLAGSIADPPQERAVGHNRDQFLQLCVACHSRRAQPSPACKLSRCFRYF